MDRREFVKLLGAGGTLACVGLIFGCRPEEAQESEQLMPEPAAGPAPDADTDEEAPANEPDEGEGTEEGADEPGDDDGAADAEDGESVGTVICPECGAENKVVQWGQEITCWKCGHKWTPQQPA